MFMFHLGRKKICYIFGEVYIFILFCQQAGRVLSRRIQTYLGSFNPKAWEPNVEVEIPPS
jgi:hypothetical protein